MSGTAIRCQLKEKEPVELPPLPPVIERRHEGKGKSVLLLMTAGDDNKTTFDHAKSYFRIISEVLGGHEQAIYCAGDCTGCEKTARHIDQKHLDNAYQLGLEL